MSGASTVLAGELGYFKGGSGFPVRYQGAKTGQLPFFKVSDMNNPGNELFMRHANNYISEKQRKRLGATRIPAGAIVFAKVGAAVYLERKRILTQDSCIDNNMAAFVVDPKRLDLRLAHYLLTDFRLSSLVATTALPSLNGGQLRSIPLRVPHDLKEQRSIVDSLADIDSFITVLECKIAKKQAIKQGMMQQLLTGRSRLSGFSGSWSEASVGEVADVKTGPFGSALHERDYVSQGTPIITVEHLGERGVVAEGAPLVSAADRSRLRAYILKAGDIVFSRVGSIDRNALISSQEDGWLFSGRLLRVRFDKTRVDPAFMSSQFHTQRFKEAVRSVAVGQTMPSLNTAILRAIPLTLPSLSEQIAIGRVAVDLNDEIDALYTRLTKAKAIKQGMMQQLLTGRAHLPVPEGVSA